MHLNKRVRAQLAFFAAITLIAGAVTLFGYLKVPLPWFGNGHYRVTLNMPNSAGLYRNSNVTYRGTEVGLVESVQLTASGVAAVMSLRSNVDIPADLDAEIHSQTAAGENFVELVPRQADGVDLSDGSVIAADRVKIPPDINSLLSMANAGLQAIPHDNLKTAIAESFTAVGGLGPELSRIVKSATTLATDARNNLDAITTVIDKSQPILDSQIDSSDSIQSWAANLAQITGQLKAHDDAVKGILSRGPAAADELRNVFERLRPSVPILLNNLVSLADVAVVYQPNIEQLLVLLPYGIQMAQGSMLADRDLKTPYKGIFLSFNLNLDVPPPCNTGYLPAQQMRTPSEVDYPDRPAGGIYCRTPQDSPFNVRGLRNLPCETRPGKRAPTVAMCESDENYIPLNDGYNWKGDSNATDSGQPVPQLPPAQGSRGTTQPAPIAIAQYDPASGTYIGPDGRQYTQTDLARGTQARNSWQDLLIPPKGN